MENTNISWADHTFNPWWGCTRVLPACDHCYAERNARRYGKPRLWKGEREPRSAAYWRGPLKLNRKAEAAGRLERMFCASMSDVFDNEAPPEWRTRLWQLIRENLPAMWAGLWVSRAQAAKALLIQRGQADTVSAQRFEN